MGLDMYLEKWTYVQRWDHHPTPKHFTVSVTRGGQPYPAIRPERVSYVIEQVCYWRKANAIHKWFVDQVQDGKDECQRSYVSREKLKDLVFLLKEILRNKDGEAGPNLLPTESGFFFGPTEYGDYYYETLERTVNTLETLLKEPPSPPLEGASDFYYRASW